jgi:hypothetical protein
MQFFDFPGYGPLITVRLRSFRAFCYSVPLALLLAGCMNQTPAGLSSITMAKQGSVHGGQQPVSGAAIQLYAVGTSGDGSAATPLLTSSAMSDANGNFSLSNYSCPTAASLVYILASGGNPGLTPGTNNTSLNMMTALGRCDSLGSSFIVVNELTTVAAVSALSPFMTSPAKVGSSSADASSLANAFMLASEFVNSSSGLAPGSNVPAGLVVPTAKINTLADIVAICINSAGGIAGDGSSCGTLFALTTLAGNPPPADIITALLHVANDPPLNTAALFDLTVPTAPFQPQLTAAPADFSIRLTTAGSGGGSSGTVSLSPTTLAFYQSGVPQAVTMTNFGLTPVVIQSINISSSDWSQTNDCGSVLAAQSICTINVQSTNSTPGTFTGSLTVVDDDTNDAQVVQLNTQIGSGGGTIQAVQCTDAAADTVLLQSALDAANAGTGPAHISVQGATCSVTSTLIIYPNTWLDVSHGTTMAGTGSFPVIQNHSVSPAGTVTGCGMTSGSTTLTCGTASFASANVGQSVKVPFGITSDGEYLMSSIVSVTDGSTVVLRDAAQNTTSGQTATLFHIDSGVKVTGGVWALSPDSAGSNAVNFKHTAHLTITDATVTTSGSGNPYAIGIGDYNNLDVERIVFLNAADDGLHLEGPGFHGHISNISGEAFPVVAVTSIDYPTQDDSHGNIFDLTIEHVSSDETTPSTLVQLEGGTGTTIRQVSVSDLESLNANMGAVEIDDDTSATSGCTDVGGVLVDGVYGLNVSSTISPSCGRDITFRNISQTGRSNTSSAFFNLVRGDDQGTWESVSIDGVVFPSGNGNGYSLLTDGFSSSVGTLSISNVSGSFTEPADGIASLGGTYQSLVENNIQIEINSAGALNGANNNLFGTITSATFSNVHRTDAFLPVGDPFLGIDGTISSLGMTNIEMDCSPPADVSQLISVGGTLSNYSTNNVVLNGCIMQ